MAFFHNPGGGNPQGMYDNAAMAAFQGVPPNQQRMQHPNAQQFAQFPNQMPPGFQAQYHPQQPPPGGQRGQPHPQFQRPMPAHVQQQMQQQHQLQYQMAQAAQAAQQQRGMNQSPGQGGDMSMMPPTTGPMNMGRNSGVTMQQGNMQRAQAQAHAQAQAQAQAQARSGNQQQFPQQEPFSFNTATPPSAGPNMGFFPQPTPSPTQAQAPSSVPGGQPGMPAGSPQVQLPQPQMQQMGGPARKTSMPLSQRQVMQPPLSPAEQERETRRVTALFNLNSELLRAAMQLQSEGRGKHPTKPNPGQPGGGQTSPTVSEHGGKDGDEPEKKSVSSPEYVECMRRVQANLTYLAAVSDRMYRPIEKTPSQPAILESLPPIQGNTIPDSQLQTLNTMYKELKEMFPAKPVGAGTAAVNGVQMGTTQPQQLQTGAR